MIPDSESVKGKGRSGTYRMTTFRDGDVMPTGSIVVEKGEDANGPFVRAWVPVKGEPK